jgi:hypothetical protein
MKKNLIISFGALFLVLIVVIVFVLNKALSSDIYKGVKLFVEFIDRVEFPKIFYLDFIIFLLIRIK